MGKLSKEVAEQDLLRWLKARKISDSKRKKIQRSSGDHL